MVSYGLRHQPWQKQLKIREWTRKIILIIVAAHLRLKFYQKSSVSKRKPKKPPTKFERPSKQIKRKK
uniref:Uncharacterized protein n=1 Tax=Romanomermis culicivorax TaxID=13658 RepID=A0A915KGQ5_ROMCU